NSASSIGNRLFANDSQTELDCIYWNWYDYGYASAGDFRDITAGSNGAYSCQSGWDCVTGIGAPIRPYAVQDVLEAIGVFPSSAPAYSGAFTLQVNGVDFRPNAFVTWNGTALPSTVGSNYTVYASVPASALTTHGPVSISVSQDGQTSN